ncbi:hypothetical protein, partial [Halorhodospira sp. 9622]|uniref:hypothetical protein n=1 Tax=Halorhodospira sp. 9622 TaxID=2899136 RepID=UPI001EE95041
QHWVNRLEQDADLTQDNLLGTMMQEVQDNPQGMGLNVNEEVRGHQVQVARTLDEMMVQDGGLDLEQVYEDIAGEGDGTFLAKYVDMLQSRDLTHNQDDLVGNDQ